MASDNRTQWERWAENIYPNLPTGRENRPRKPRPDVTVTHGPLTTECFRGANGRLARKIEYRNGELGRTWEYTFDDKGHLTKVDCGYYEGEKYEYNQRGQRIRQETSLHRCFQNATVGAVFYDEAGRVIQAGDTRFTYDARGALASRRDLWEITTYEYGKDTMLDRVILPSGVEIRYEYDRELSICPVKRFSNGILRNEYLWADPLHLQVYRDYGLELTYRFFYDTDGRLNFMSVAPYYGPSVGDQDAGEEKNYLCPILRNRLKQRLYAFLQEHDGCLELACGCDQVGTLKLLTNRKNGAVIKQLEYDSFGVPMTDSFLDLFIPIGFAGGLRDRDTGLVRFGYRDYDPAIGRFTAPDPLGDTGGDHDLYDYCVDDPVSMNDPTGLNPGIGGSVLQKILSSPLGKEAIARSC